MKERIETSETGGRIEQASHLIGKKLIHVNELDPKSGVGFVFCFGDKITDMTGPMLVIRLEPVSEGIDGMRFYPKGIWHDKEVVVN